MVEVLALAALAMMSEQKIIDEDRKFGVNGAQNGEEGRASLTFFPLVIVYPGVVFRTYPGYVVFLKVRASYLGTGGPLS